MSPRSTSSTAFAEAAKLGRADETMVLVTDRVEADVALGGQFDDYQRRIGQPHGGGDFHCAPRQTAHLSGR